MIKPTELMINNWVIIKDNVRGDYNYQITGHDLEEMESFEDDYKSNGVVPIPLTPEILEKCGFENIKEAWQYLKIKTPENYLSENGYCKLTYCKGCCGIITKVGSGFSITQAAEIIKENEDKEIDDDAFQLNIEHSFFLWNKVEFLHQLQNLYFALTGEELKINLYTHDN